jgi:hypothetical protein
MRTNNGALKEQVKEPMKTLHDKKKNAQLGLEQGIGFIPYGGVGYGMVKTLVKSDNAPMRAAAAKKLVHDPDPVTAQALVDATHDKNPGGARGCARGNRGTRRSLAAAQNR